MADFEFDKKRIDQETIGIGVHVQPPIELALDVLRIQEFYNQVSDQFPNLFAELSQSKTEFRINKKIPIPGKGEVSVTTFTLTQRGPVFNFPITLPGLLDAHEWSKTLNEDVIKCLETFHRHMPGTKFFRIGKVRKLVFQCEGIDGNEFFRKRFCRHAPESSKELTVGWNDPDDDFNRKLAAKVVEKKQVVYQEVGGEFQQVVIPKGEYGIEVVFDVNNRALDEPLDGERMKSILDHADELYRDYFYDILKGEQR